MSLLDESYLPSTTGSKKQWLGRNSIVAYKNYYVNSF
jgi:hypothetical protein